MTAQEFAYWLQGFFEMTEGTPKLTDKQIKMIKDHLQLVFTNVTDPAITPTLERLSKVWPEGWPDGPEKWSNEWEWSDKWKPVLC